MLSARSPWLRGSIMTSGSQGNHFMTTCWWLLLAGLSAFGAVFAADPVCMAPCGADCTGTCPEDYAFQCTDGTCVSLTKYRDGAADCPDKSDESCCPTEYQCDLSGDSAKCCPASFVDNGVTECNDYSDETQSVEKACTSLREGGNTIYTCETEAVGPKVGKCILNTQVLDGVTDCPLGDDEDRTKVNTCTLKLDNCAADATCTYSETGDPTFTCACNTGFTGDGVTCTSDKA